MSLQLRLSRLFAFSTLTIMTASAQTGGIGNPGEAPGTPAQSYALSGVDHVNYLSGNLNVSIPVLAIGGRGGASSAVSVPIEREWTVYNSSGVYGPSTALWPTLAPAYALGTINVVADSANPFGCFMGGEWVGFGPFTTNIVFTSNNGTQTILYDTLYNGEKKGADMQSCAQAAGYPYTDRGRTFRSMDGTDLTFVADADIYDGGFGGSVPGTLITRDGMRRRFGSVGFVNLIGDRNGNQITYAWSATANGGTFTATDPVGRQDTINYTENLGTLNQDVLTYHGYNGASRTVTVSYDLLQNTLATGKTLQTYHCLFPELSGGSSSTNFNPYVVKSITLPDFTTYQMQYNAYGELVKLTLPTGAFYAYIYAEAGCTANNGSGVIPLQDGSYKIYRRLLERDEYANGTSVSAKIIFSATAYPSGLDFYHSARPGTLTQVDFQNSSGGLLSREKHYFYSDPSSSAPPPTDETTFAAWWWGLEFRTETGSASTTLQTAQNVYGQRPCNTGEDCWFGDPNSETTPAHDIQVCQSNTVLDSGAFSSLVLQYDQNNNVLNKWEYDFGPAPGIAVSCPSVAPAPAGWTRVTTNTYMTDNVYITANLVSLPVSTAVTPCSVGTCGNATYAYDETAPSDAAGIVGHDSTYGTTFILPRGNPTTISRNSSTQGIIKTTLAYDIAGNVKKVTDQNSHATNIVYSDPNNTYAHPTQQTNALTQVTNAQYDLGTGKITSVTDPNGVTTTYAYNDPLDRPTQVIAASGTAVETRTAFTYTGTTQVTQKQDQVTAGDGALRTDMFYDKLGRLTETRNYETLSQYISTTQSYDALGRIATSTNPSRPGDGLGYTTTYSYDSLGRQLQIQTPDNALTTTSYSGNQTTVTDPAGNVRQTYTDGLGRLTFVIEDPGTTPHLNYSTSYTYDVLDNLKTVTQGAQTRTFNYDNLGWLSSAVQPESGTISYLYDGVGNLMQRTDARGIQTNYTYDALNRISGKTYTDTTPSVTYTYDNLTNSKGRMTKIVNANSTTNYSTFDPLGRVTGSNQVIGGITYPFSYVYNRASAMTSETYPTGRVITTNYDGANRPSSVTGTLSGVPRTYASPISYAPHGAISSMTLGNSIPQTQVFNSRLEPTQIAAGSLMTLGYGYGTTNNNGNPVSHTIARPGVSTSLTYGYDGANRLGSASQTGTTAWSQTYGFDNFGNRWLSGNTGLPTPTQEVPQTSAWYGTNNRIGSWSYDLAGNILSISGMTRAFTYDAENLQKTAAVNGTTTTYLYDGNGHRVKKTVGAGTPTVYVYDALGNLAVEYGLPFDVGTKYLTADSLGSTRLVTKADGTVDRTYDYLPFGQEIGATYPNAPSGPSQKFTGQERDAESGLDNFGARYMSSAQGRFMSVDPAFQSEILEYPQTWNRYSYVYNAPLRFRDPDGRCPNCFAAAAGAGIGGLIEAGVDLYTQLHNNGGNWSQIDGGELAGSIAQGVVAGGLAGFTMGGSLVADIAVGGAGNMVGGIVKRTIESAAGDATVDPLGGNDVATDIVSGAGGAAIGHGVATLAARVTHAPVIGPRPRPGRNFRARQAAYTARQHASQIVQIKGFAVGTAAGTATSDWLSSAISTGWNSLDWLIYSSQPPPPPPPPNFNTSGLIGCWDMQGNSCD